MKYEKPTLFSTQRVNLPITANFSPPPVETGRDASDNISIQGKTKLPTEMKNFVDYIVPKSMKKEEFETLSAAGFDLSPTERANAEKSQSFFIEEE